MQQLKMLQITQHELLLTEGKPVKCCVLAQDILISSSKQTLKYRIALSITYISTSDLMHVQYRWTSAGLSSQVSECAQMLLW